MRVILLHLPPLCTTSPAKMLVITGPLGALDAFVALKHYLTTSMITSFPAFNLHFRLHTDVSHLGLSAILAQVQNGKERTICHTSKVLNHSEKNYPATKLECPAIIWATEKFQPYLMAVKFDVFTDYYALQ